MKTIDYSLKSTNANTQYLSISQQDTDFLLMNLLKIQSYFNELSLSTDKTHKEFKAWYCKSHKNFLYNKNLKRSNSPQSLIAGAINNLWFGTQRDFSLNQLEALQIANNLAVNVIDFATQEGLNLQQHNPETFFIKIAIYNEDH